jgi:hypothetical protein
MFQAPVKTASKPVKSRLGVKLAALFLGSFLTAFVGLLFLDLLMSLGENVLVDSAATNQPATAAIDPKLESELAKVLENNDAQPTADIKNPFADTSGISDKSIAPINSAATTAPGGTNTKAVNPAATVGQSNQPPRAATQQNVPGTSVQPNQNAKQTPQTDTPARLKLREERIRLGADGGPEAAVYAIDDLLPVGLVSGGDGKEEVMFYSASTCRVVSFPVGTQFYDGWFDAMRQEGVVLGFFDQSRTMRMRAWGRSVETNCSQSSTETNSQNRTSATGGGD